MAKVAVMALLNYLYLLLFLVFEMTQEKKR
jgi:hypothetical protein